MIRILRHTLCLVLLLTLAACEKDREPRIEVSTGEIHLPGDASSGTTLLYLIEILHQTTTPVSLTVF